MTKEETKITGKISPPSNDKDTSTNSLTSEDSDNKNRGNINNNPGGIEKKRMHSIIRNRISA